MPSAVLPDSFVSFDLFPSSAYVNIEVVARLHDCAPGTVWRRVARGQIPPPRKFGGSSSWSVVLLREALAQTGSTDATGR
jgi:predicted DNA-binding transcriptional regulator AlpA